MEISELVQLFEKHLELGEYGHFERIPVNERRSERPDLHAMLILDELLPGKGDMVVVAAHDRIWLDASGEDLVQVVKEDDVIEFLRCGFVYDDDVDLLRSYV